jgi:serpin B
MTVILPKPGNSVASVAASLDTAAWQRLTASFVKADVDLYLPKLTMQWQSDLIPHLQSLGMHAAFVQNGADFTGMSSRGRELYLSLVRQKTFVAIDEEGTEAAAVTGVGVTITAAQVPIVMRVDRPYIFVIRERLPGTVLSMGRITRAP